jgi:hypothetical protein
MSGRVKAGIVLFVEIALVVGYLVAFGIFVTQSEDFLIAHNNSHAAAAAAAREPELPAFFEFGLDRPDDELLGQGWHGAEDGRWTKSPALLFLPVVADAGPMRLVIDGRPFLAEGRDTASMTLSIDGTQVAQWAATFGEPLPVFEVMIPSAAAADGLLELQIEAPAIVPSYHSQSLDKRKIGFLVRSISITAADDPNVE